MKITADLHVHSKYSEAVSPQMTIANMAAMAEKKGITLLGTGDFTHPLYLRELKDSLQSSGRGLFKLAAPEAPRVHFMLTSEVTNIFFSRLGKEKRTHVILLASSFSAVEKINGHLGKWGDLRSDGRPTFRRHVKDLVKLVLDTAPDSMIIPAHAWTPWYSVFGSFYGFNSLEECFEEETPNIRAVETGLDSDPEMNWRISDLDGISLISCSDAHSLSRIGREASVFNCAMDYAAVTSAIKDCDASRFTETIELFPSIGKYYLDGHRKCGVSFTLEETRRKHYKCPACKNPLTVGVHHRIETLASRPEGFRAEGRVPFKYSIPLENLIADALGLQPKSKTVQDEWAGIIHQLGPELPVLHEVPEQRLRALLKPEFAENILRMREGKVSIEPGYDGVYGIPRLKMEQAPAPSSQFELF